MFLHLPCPYLIQATVTSIFCLVSLLLVSVHHSKMHEICLAIDNLWVVCQWLLDWVSMPGVIAYRTSILVSACPGSLISHPPSLLCSRHGTDFWYLWDIYSVPDTAKSHNHPTRQEQASFNISAFFSLASGLCTCCSLPKIILLPLPLLFVPLLMKLIHTHTLGLSSSSIPSVWNSQTFLNLGYMSHPSCPCLHYTLYFSYHHIKHNCFIFLCFLSPFGLP